MKLLTFFETFRTCSFFFLLLLLFDLLICFNIFGFTFLLKQQCSPFPFGLEGLLPLCFLIIFWNMKKLLNVLYFYWKLKVNITFAWSRGMFIQIFISICAKSQMEKLFYIFKIKAWKSRLVIQWNINFATSIDSCVSKYDFNYQQLTTWNNNEWFI